MRGKRFASTVVLSAVCLVAVAVGADAGTTSAFDCGCHAAAPGRAEAYCDAFTGELCFHVGQGVAVIGISFPNMYHDQVDIDSIFGKPAQNSSDVLAYFNTSGLSVGGDSVGFVAPPELRGGCILRDTIFSYTPVGGQTHYDSVWIVPSCLPEPSTIVMTLLGLAILGVYSRRRGDR